MTAMAGILKEIATTLGNFLLLLVVIAVGDADRNTVENSRSFVELYTDVVEWLPHLDCCEPAMNISYLSFAKC